MKIEKFTFNPFEENTYVLFDDSNKCIIVDPGNAEQHEHQNLVNFITSHNLSPEKVVNTHCHIDHVLGVEFLKEHFKIPFYIPKYEDEVYKAVKAYAAPYGFPQFKEVEVDAYMDEKDDILFGNTKLQVIGVPGHSPGHVVFFHEEENVLIGGDVLFQGSIGRTDLPGGNHEALISNIKTKLFNLADEVVVYAGHGPETTIGYEKKTNPFLT